MSQILTYNSLVTKLISYTERFGDTAMIDNIPFFVLMAQSRISNDLNILGMQQTVTGAMQAGVNIIQKPSRWLRTISFTISDPDYSYEVMTLQKRTLEYVKNYSINSEELAKPEFYSDQTFDSFYIGSTPDKAYPYELVYHELLEPLDETNQSNWITQRVPHLLFYACLREAYVFFMSEEKATYYVQDYEKALAAIKQQDEMGTADRSAIKEIN